MKKGILIAAMFLIFLFIFHWFLRYDIDVFTSTNGMPVKYKVYDRLTGRVHWFDYSNQYSVRLFPAPQAHHIDSEILKEENYFEIKELFERLWKASGSLRKAYSTEKITKKYPNIDLIQFEDIFHISSIDTVEIRPQSRKEAEEFALRLFEYSPAVQKKLDVYSAMKKYPDLDMKVISEELDIGIESILNRCLKNPNRQIVDDLLID